MKMLFHPKLTFAQGSDDKTGSNDMSIGQQVLDLSILTARKNLDFGYMARV